ncbi:hypothetical protein MFLO_12156 [Listeria floridensis FSL S10-1187]|uniref:LXG domain-containing protein n=1 Tax=Listeria floridensis FSL S10-1187 TaxID=1265817 RepID=A0ABP3AX34_9LIST|nr:T7SS effector LXG polymorphic toxin [Listeria floridensis]EUJ28497.1 hypothetical protein MFLO_12156 [Listeria floridensis FSL S10-1187]
MSVNMFIGKSNGQADSVSSICQSHIQGMQLVKSAIRHFSGEPSLKGKTYDSAKEYFKMVYLPLAEGIILVAKHLEQSVKMIPQDYQVDVDSNSLQEDVLRSQINQLEALAGRVEELVTPDGNDALGIGKKQMAELFRSSAQASQEKLTKLLNYDVKSAQFFTDLENLLADVEAGLNAASSGKGFNSQTGTFSIDAFEMDWSKRLLKQANEESKAELEGLLNKYPDISEQELNEILNIMRNNPDLTVSVALGNKILNIFEGFGSEIGQALQTAGGFLGTVGNYIKNEIRLEDILISSAEAFGMGLVRFGGQFGSAFGPAGANSFVMMSPRGVTISNAGRGFIKYAKGAGWAVAGVTTVWGIYDDISNNDKTVGEAITHNVVSTGATMGGAFLVGAMVSTNPIGWGFAAGVAIGAGFSWAYDNNFLGLQDKLDWVGGKIDDGIDWAGSKINDGVDFVSDKLDDVGEAVSGVLDFINPFN